MPPSFLAWMPARLWVIWVMSNAVDGRSPGVRAAGRHAGASLRVMGHLGHRLSGDNVTQWPRGHRLRVLGHLGHWVIVLKSLDPLCHVGDTVLVATRWGRGDAAKHCIPIQYISILLID